MSITRYSELDSALDNWLKRTDLTNRIPEFVTLAEARMWYGEEDEQYGNEPLRVRPMEASTDLTIAADGTAPLPAGFLQAVRIYVRSDGVNMPLQYFPRTDFYSRELAQSPGTPAAYTIEGENFVFGTAGSGTPKLLYYKKPDALDSTNDDSTNAVLTTNPMIYLSGALLEASLYIRSPEEAQVWARRFRSAIGGWNASDRRDRQVGPLISRPVAVS